MLDGHCTAKALAALDIEVGQHIQSIDYLPGVSGWFLGFDGSDDGLFEANTGVFRAKLATEDFDTSHMDIDGGLLQIDVSASSAAIFTTADRDLLLSAADAVSITSHDGPVTVTSNNDGDVTINSDGDIDLNSAGGSIRIGINNGESVGFFGDAGITKPTITGSRDSNVALGNLLGFLHNMGLIVNDTTT